MNKVNLKPAPGYILIDPLKVEKTESGIYLPENVAEQTQKALVLEVGEDEILSSGVKKTSPVKKGETVLYRKSDFDGPVEVKIGDKKCLIIKFESVLAIETK
jgi:co-chaperonin GroES (HSP10)